MDWQILVGAGISLGTLALAKMFDLFVLGPFQDQKIERNLFITDRIKQLRELRQHIDFALLAVNDFLGVRFTGDDHTDQLALDAAMREVARLILEVESRAIETGIQTVTQIATEISSKRMIEWTGSFGKGESNPRDTAKVMQNSLHELAHCVHIERIELEKEKLKRRPVLEVVRKP